MFFHAIFRKTSCFLKKMLIFKVRLDMVTKYNYYGNEKI